jgi:DNA-binding GntR family transcriptional regulator
MAPSKKDKSSRNHEDHTQKAYNGLRQMMFHNEIVPGQKIAYRDLADRLGMSLTPVIQALKWMEIQGLVRHEAHRGYHAEPFSLQEVEELHDLREVLECSLLPKTIERLDDKNIKALYDAFMAHAEASSETYLNERFVKDLEFHIALASLSGCRVQLQVLRNLLDILCLKYRSNYQSAASFDRGVSEHQAVYEAISDQNLGRAQKALGHHIRFTKETLIERFTQILEEKKDLGFPDISWEKRT